MVDVATQLEQSVLEREYPVYIGIFMIIVIVIAVLSFIVISQSKKINELQKPRYGFLGKPLAVVFVIGILAGSYGIIFLANKATNVPNVSADRDVELSINYKAAGQSKYVFNVIPVVDNTPWGENPENQFDVYWTISNTSTVSQIELGLSLNKQGGILVTLDKGQYKIRTSVFFLGKSYEKEVDFTVAN